MRPNEKSLAAPGLYCAVKSREDFFGSGTEFVPSVDIAMAVETDWNRGTVTG